jgi:ferredoxin-type protein NapH
LVFFGTLTSSTLFSLIVIADPLTALEVVAASRTLPLTLLGGAAIITIFYALIRGRAFCGWACPLGLLIEIANFIGNKTGLRNRAALSKPLPRYSKLVSAALILLASGLMGLPVFELVSPVTALPRLFVLGVGVGIWVLIAIVVLELVYPGRLWCTSLCPVGGFYETIGCVGLVGVKMGTGCTSCDTCRQVCLSDTRILDNVIAGQKTLVSAGDCMVCGRCVDQCPSKSLSWHFGPAFIQPRKKALNQSREAGIKEASATETSDTKSSKEADNHG